MAATQKSFNDWADLVLFSRLWGRKITGSKQVRNRSTTGPHLDRIRRVENTEFVATMTLGGGQKKSEPKLALKLASFLELVTRSQHQLQA
jgi:hypothetical protein